MKNKNTYYRLNYLIQASYLMKNNTSISRYYLKLLKNIASSSVIRLDTNVKKIICKKCNSLLIPGETSNTRLKSNKKQPSYIVHKCLFCGNCRKNYI
jgi:ribonuclease P protein subunit RPR2